MSSRVFGVVGWFKLILIIIVKLSTLSASLNFTFNNDSRVNIILRSLNTKQPSNGI